MLLDDKIPVSLNPLIATLLIFAISGCVSFEKPRFGANKQAQTKTSIRAANFADPGSYKNIDVDGASLRLGRFAPGKFGGDLVLSIVGTDPKTFNCWSANDTLSAQLSALMHPGLLNIDYFSGNMVADLAESWTMDPDGVTYIVKLRHGVTWSDGNPITAEDVLFTWNTIVAGGYGNTSYRDGTTINGKSPTVTAIDPYTVKFVTPGKFATFVRHLGIAIAPKHVFEPIVARKDGHAAFEQFWAANPNLKASSFVTSGPFVLSRYIPGQRVEMVATKNYYTICGANKKRLPYLNRITFLIVPDPNTNLLKFEAKELDNTVVRARDSVGLISKEAANNFTLLDDGPMLGSVFIAFNMNRRNNPKTNKPYIDPIKSKWFNDVNFRQAINHAISRDQFVANYFKGIGMPQYVCEASSSPWLNRSLPPLKQDFALSRQYLEKSGFKLGADNYLHDKEGNRVEFDWLTMSGSTFMETLGDLVTTDLKQLGMKVNFAQMDFNVLGDKINQSCDWQTVLYAFGPGDPCDPNDGANVWKSDGRLHIFDQRMPDKNGKITVTDARSWEKRLDEIFNLAPQTIEVTERHKLYDEYQKIIYDQAPLVYTAAGKTIVANRNTVKNFEPTPLSNSLMSCIHNFEELYKE